MWLLRRKHFRKIVGTEKALRNTNLNCITCPEFIFLCTLMFLGQILISKGVISIDSTQYPLPNVFMVDTTNPAEALV